MQGPTGETWETTFASSSTMRSNVRGEVAASLHPRPARSYAHARVNLAIAGCTTAQLSDDAAMPDSKSTTGRPAPLHVTCSRWPPTSIRSPGGISGSMLDYRRRAQCETFRGGRRKTPGPRNWSIRIASFFCASVRSAALSVWHRHCSSTRHTARQCLDSQPSSSSSC